MKASFESWMDKVDAAVEAIAGLSVYDLADIAFRDLYEDGVSARSVARMALAEEGF